MSQTNINCRSKRSLYSLLNNQQMTQRWAMLSKLITTSTQLDKWMKQSNYRAKLRVKLRQLLVMLVLQVLLSHRSHRHNNTLLRIANSLWLTQKKDQISKFLRQLSIKKLRLLHQCKSNKQQNNNRVVPRKVTVILLARTLIQIMKKQNLSQRKKQLMPRHWESTYKSI